MTDYYARDNETLKNHLINVSRLASIFGKKVGVTNSAYLIGLLHDFGKYTKRFQEYLEKSLNNEEDVRRGEVVHAFQGAKFLNEKISVSYVFELLANIIESHHGGLFDGIDGYQKPVLRKLEHEELYYEESKHAFLAELEKFLPNFSLVEDEIKDFIKKVTKVIQEKEKSLNSNRDIEAFFQLHFLTKFLFSCLVDADRFDAAGEDAVNELTIYDTNFDWDFFIMKFEHYMEAFTYKTSLNHVRKKISDMLASLGKERECGVYSLCIPTGAGKTLSSLRFALYHAKKHNKKRIIYIIPYLSIIDQTAQIFKDIFHCDNVDSLILEHHSNFEIDDNLKNNEEGNDYNLLTSRWNAPIIITTMVQFMETVYSNKASKLRKFHNMSDAVIIFDEIQATPVKCLNLLNGIINFLQLFAKSSLILCTATEPSLYKTKHPIISKNDNQLVTLTCDEEKIFERVKLIDKLKCNNNPYTYSELLDLVEKELNLNKSTLIIFNTKATAKNFYEECQKSELNVKKFFLSTDLCPQHRLDILVELKNALNEKNDMPVLCISTQLIEAGVDISFDTVFRVIAPMDSIIQAAGRCNRNGESLEKSSVYIINIEGEDLSKLPEIQIGARITERVLRENAKNLLNFKLLLDNYFTYFYAETEINNRMDYRIEDGTESIYGILNLNYYARKTFEKADIKYEGIPCAFKKAADNFSVIDGEKIDIVVPYKEADDLIQEFLNIYQDDVNAKRKILHKLGRYVVSVYPWVIEKLSNAHALSIIKNNKKDSVSLYYLSNRAYYDINGVGLKLIAELEFLAL